MEIIYITESDQSDGLVAWEALKEHVNKALSALTLESYAGGVLVQEGFKETLRHLWEKLVEQLKKLIAWIKEKTTSDKARLLRARDRVETLLGLLHGLQAHRAPLDHVVVPMTAMEYRHLAKTPKDRVDMRMLGEAHTDMTRAMGLFFESHVDYVRTQMRLITEAFGKFDVLQADAQLAELKAKLAQLPFKGFGPDETHISVVGMATIVLDKTSHPGLDELAFVGTKLMASTVTSGFRAPPVGAAIAIMVNLREVLNRAIQFQEHVLPTLEATHQQLLRAGGSLMKRVNEMTSGNTDGSHIEAVVKEMLGMEAKIASSVMRPLVPAFDWIINTADAMSGLIGRAVESAQHQEAPKPGSITPALPAPT